MVMKSLFVAVYNATTFGGCRGIPPSLVPSAGTFKQRWPHCWVSPEPSAPHISRTSAQARQRAALLGEKQAEITSPVHTRPLHFPLTHHTWAQPGGHQQNPLTWRMELPTSPRSSLVLNPSYTPHRAGWAPPACNRLLRLGQSCSCGPAQLLGVGTENLPREAQGGENTSCLIL